MKISIITVAYNSEKTISNAIESVLNQKFTGQQETELEYIIIDGKSSDDTVNVAQDYRDRFKEKSEYENVKITYRIISEPDGGIYDAMNKGTALAMGDVTGILNSDDWYEEDTLQTVADTFKKTDCELLYGNIRMHRADGSTFIKKARLRKFETSRDWNHPTTFVKSELYKEYPFRNLGIHDDYGFFLQMKQQKRKIVIIDKVLANFRMGGASNKKDFKAAKKRIMDRYRYCYRINGFSRLYMIECVAIEMAKWIIG